MSKSKTPSDYDDTMVARLAGIYLKKYRNEGYEEAAAWADRTLSKDPMLRELVRQKVADRIKFIKPKR